MCQLLSQDRLPEASGGPPIWQCSRSRRWADCAEYFAGAAARLPAANMRGTLYQLRPLTYYKRFGAAILAYLDQPSIRMSTETFESE